MSLVSAVTRLRRIISKPPSYVIGRAVLEAERELDRWLAPRRERALGRDRLLSMGGTNTVDELWKQLALRPFPANTNSIERTELNRIEPGETTRILGAADRACDRIVDLLGIGPTALGSPIKWSHDYRVGFDWPHGFARSIDYVNRGRPSDVKVPWEISRLQWLIPAGQAYLLTGNECYAAAVRDILDEWMRANPLCYTVNWSCAMEAALRIFTWTWFFHVFAKSRAWSDEDFRVRFLSCLYLHGDFTSRHIEKADINGNHYVADLAGLVMAGLFFGSIGNADKWTEVGWSGLNLELYRQVLPDGVDYEASCAYHRLVFELFFWPAQFRKVRNENVPAAYVERLRRMARFTACYSRVNGTTPLWGDADDGRVLPFGGQAIGDHRYLLGLVSIAFDDPEFASLFGGSRSELAWTFGLERAARLPQMPQIVPGSAAFPEGGLYIMREGGTHIFIDCGPVGMAGRGGHGHNDALSFEAWLDEVPLITDCGSYVYTASFQARNRFRSTYAHNTPQVDGEEINRFVAFDNLWNFHDDARALCTEWRTERAEDVFSGIHRGYQRLGVEIRRTIRFDKATSSLEITDTLNGDGQHDVAIPLHLAPDVTVERTEQGFRLHSHGRVFELASAPQDGWVIDVEPCFVSASYGVATPSQRLMWRRQGVLPFELRMFIKSAAQ